MAKHFQRRECESNWHRLEGAKKIPAWQIASPIAMGRTDEPMFERPADGTRALPVCSSTWAIILHPSARPMPEVSRCRARPFSESMMFARLSCPVDGAPWAYDVSRREQKD